MCFRDYICVHKLIVGSSIDLLHFCYLDNNVAANICFYR